ncbi:MAG: MBOAT family protein [Lachnospiraceae bacterium]|jgi:D-alanyl-lipoteichoic acid acyltransferase DltB (MBOAT superfamily)|nr:MBOAT family protein [Lachnospiraceae bacterium]
MLFNSYIFILAFLPICLAGFWILSQKHMGSYDRASQNGMSKNDLSCSWCSKSDRSALGAKLWLIGFSFIFYAYFNVKYLMLLFVLMAVNYAAHCGIVRRRETCQNLHYDECNGQEESASPRVRRAGHIIMICAVILDLTALVYFKYMNFFITSVNSAFNANHCLKNIMLPLGISFIVFQQIGFLTNTYRTCSMKEKCSFVDYVLFSSFFPSISAGPITTADEMIPQFDAIGTKRIDGEKFVRGFILFVFGLSKKMLLADKIGVGVDYGWNNELSMQGPSCFILMLLYAFQLYFDFSGYCDMGRGIAQMLGMDLPVNFDSPYKAVNIVDFWKRWHITLSRFFRDNVYIPLGGNRKGKARTNINLFLVYLISGFWHGAGWNYIFWGILHGILYVPTKIYLAWKKSHTRNMQNRGAGTTLHRLISVMLTFLYTSFACIYFRAPSVASGNGMIMRMFDGYPLVDRGLGRSFNTGVLWYVLKILHIDGYAMSDYLIMYAFLAVSFLVIFVLKRNAAEYAKKVRLNFGTALVFAVMLVICIMSMSNVTSFIYYKF